MSHVRPGRHSRVAVVGLHAAGAHHAERLALRPEVGAVIGCDGEPRLRERAPHLLAEIVSRIDEVLASPHCELVVIATPAPTHAELVARALAAGKHVVVEPPLAVSAAECEFLVELARRHARLLRIAYDVRSDDDAEAARQIVRGGRLGPIRTARRRLWTWTAENRDRPANDEVDNFAMQDASGCLIEYGIPLLDQLLEFVARRPVAVSASRTSAESPGPPETDVAVEIRFEGGATGQLDVDTRSAVHDDDGWLLIGENGGYAGQRLFQRTAEGEIFDEPIEPAADRNPWDRFFDGVLTSIDAGDSVDASAARAATVMRLVEAIRASAANGGVVSIPSDRTRGDVRE